MNRCPRCNGSGIIEEFNDLERAIDMLRRDSRRDIYQTIHHGVFAVSYLKGEQPLHLSRLECDKLVGLGIVFEDPDCKGWFHQIGYKRPERRTPTDASNPDNQAATTAQH